MKSASLIKLILLAVAVFLIVWFVRNSNISQIGEYLSQIKFKFLWIIAATWFAYMLVSAAWMLSFTERQQHITVLDLFNIRMIGESLAQINPTSIIAGETLKAVVLRQKGVSYNDGIASLMISRFLIMFSSVSLIIGGIVVFINKVDIKGGLAVVFILIFLITVVISIFLFLLIRGKGIISIPLSLILRFFPGNPKLLAARDKAAELDAALAGFWKFKKLNFAGAYFLSLMHWFAGAGEFYLILNFLGLDVSFASCIAIEVGIMVIKAVGSFVPGQIGVEEFGNKLMLEFVGISGGEVWIAVSILRRARQLFWIGYGASAFMLIRKSVSRKEAMPDVSG